MSDTSDNTIQARWYFSVPIYEKMLPGFCENRQELIDTLSQMRKQDTGVNRSNLGGWHSHDRLHLSEDPTTRNLMHSILSVATACIDDFEQDRDYGRIVMTQAWANVNDTHNWNVPHMHLPSDWSGVLYVSVEPPDESDSGAAKPGDIMFFNPMPMSPRYKRPTTVNYTPREGLLLLFPGYLLHMVAPHNASRPRISISFNIKVELNDQAL